MSDYCKCAAQHALLSSYISEMTEMLYGGRTGHALKNIFDVDDILKELPQYCDDELQDTRSKHPEYDGHMEAQTEEEFQENKRELQGLLNSASKRLNEFSESSHEALIKFIMNATSIAGRYTCLKSR